MRALQLSCSTAGSGSGATRHWGPQCCCCPRTLAVRAAAVANSSKLGLTLAASPVSLGSCTAAAALAAVLLLQLVRPAAAHIAIDQLPQPQTEAVRAQPVIPGSTAGFEPSAVGQLRGRRPVQQPSSSRSRTRQQSVTATEALEALQQLKSAEALFKAGDYAAALQGYTALVKQHPDLALTEYARLGQALCMYQVGDTQNALTELNELEAELRGNPETHAALAAVLYAERPAQRWRAEQQWDIAVEFDSRYTDASWVQQNKHWPPRLLGALQQFLSLR